MHVGMRMDGVWSGLKELLAAAELWNLRIVVVRAGHATVLVGKGERIVWLKLESRHCEFLASDNSEEFKAARRGHIKEIAEIYKVAFSKLDCVKDDCVKDIDGGAAPRGGLPLEDSPSVCSLSCPCVRSSKRARLTCSKGTSSACSMSVCEKMSPSARGLIESKLQRIEEVVSVKVSRGGARFHVVSLLLGGEELGGSVASGSKVTALSKWSGAVARREHEMAMVQIFRRSQNLANVAADEQSVGKTPCLVVVAQTSAKTLRNSVEDASTLKPSCRRGSRVCKKPSRAETVKREHRNEGPSCPSRTALRRGTLVEVLLMW